MGRAVLEAETAEALVRAAKAGDQRAYGELVRRYRPRIVALALHLTGSRAEAEDIAQETFIRALEKLDSFEGRSQFFTWVYRIAVHRALNAKRSAGVRRAMPIEDPRVDAAIDVDADGDPRKAVELQETYGQLLAAFDGLSDVLRTTLVLVTLQGMSHAEAAVVLGSTEGTIAWRVHEARKQMQQTLRRLERDPTPTHVRLQGARVGRAHTEQGEEAALRLLMPMLAGLK